MDPYTRNPIEDLRRFFLSRSVLSNLIIINIGVWLLVKITGVLFFLYLKPGADSANEWFLHFFAVPAYIPILAKVPWTPLTYMFLHFDFWHILFNMLWLFWFGKIFIEYLDSKQLLLTYILGGLSGALFYIAAYNFFPVFNAQLPFSYALGASASVMDIVTSVAFYIPNYTIQLLFIGRVKIIYLALILFIFDFFAITGSNSGGHIAHIGGALWGFFYIFLSRKGSVKLFSANFSGWMNNLKKRFTSGKRQTDFFHNFDKRPVSDEEYNLEKNERQRRIDEILEKISKGGYESLTKSEKEFLFKTSGRNK
jgi:membrane associated rhomboid family serine protease